MAAIAFLFTLYIAIPVALARYVIRANWREVAAAYGIVVGIMVLFSLAGPNGQKEEAFGWAMILAMFYTIPAVPVFSLAVRLTRRFR